MEISFTKKGEGLHIISCKRKDDSVTWMHSSYFFVVHDICHYAVETKLGFAKAFYGMLASGISIADFELPKERRPFELTEEAILAENLVNLLSIEYSQGQLDDFTDTLLEKYPADFNLVTILNNGALDEIRNTVKLLMNKWNTLKEGETLTLVFED